MCNHTLTLLCLPGGWAHFAPTLALETDAQIKTLNGVLQNCPIVVVADQILWRPEPKVDNASLQWQKAMQKPTRFNRVPPYCPLSSSVPLSFYLWSYISDWMILFCRSTYTRRQRGKRGSVGAFSEKIVDTRTQRRAATVHTHTAYIICRTSACHQMWHQRLLVTWIALASWCFSFDMAQCYFSDWHIPPAAVPGSLQASVLHAPTMQVSFWLSG